MREKERPPVGQTGGPNWTRQAARLCVLPHHTPEQQDSQASLLEQLAEGLAAEVVPSLLTYEGAERFGHRDLRTLSADELDREHVRASLARALLRARDPRQAWLTERVAAIRAELRERRGDGGR